MVLQLLYNKEIICKLPVSKYMIYVIRKMEKKIFLVYTSTQQNRFLTVVPQQPHEKLLLVPQEQLRTL